MRIKGNDYNRKWNNKTRRWVYKHRTVLEQHLKRKLTSAEHVHHINGNILDNEIENLIILTRAQHASISCNKRSLHPICTVENCENKHHAKGLCRKHYNKWTKLKSHAECKSLPCIN